MLTALCVKLNDNSAKDKVDSLIFSARGALS